MPRKRTIADAASTTADSSTPSPFAADGQQGLEYAGAAYPDLVLLDTLLPQLDGFAVCWTPQREYDVLRVLMEHAGQADRADVRVEFAGNSGVTVNSAGDDGVHVDSADDDGVFVGAAVDGFDCGGGITDTCFESGSALNYAAYFDGHMSVTGSCAGCTLSAFGHNAGPAALEPGDVVAVRGMTNTDMQNAPTVMEVDRAAGSGAVTGVVAGWAEVVKKEEGATEAAGETEIAPRLVPCEGPAPVGEYVNIITYGMVQVKASAVSAPIQEGTRLTMADEAGHARAVKTVKVEGVEMAENTPILGIALESLEAGQDLIWVLVYPR